MLGVVAAAGVARGLVAAWRGRRAVAAVVAVVVVLKLRGYLARRSRRQRWDAAGADVVVLHAFPRGRHAPNISPYVLALEAYLRLTKIPYVADYEVPTGPKGKSPWITLNGADMGDSQLIMEHLGHRYGKVLTARLTEEEQGVATALSAMVTEKLAWGLRVWRYRDDWGIGLRKSLPNAPIWLVLSFPLYRRRVVRDLWAQGMGRHTSQEVERMVRKDLAALSAYLGDKPYLFGSEACEADCTAFGFLAQIKWHYPGAPYPAMLEEDFPNLDQFVIRMKETLWPNDWKQ